MSTLIIKNVDFEQLESQRLLLNSALTKLPDGEAKDAVKGIRNMLDAWSDEQLKEKKPEYMCGICGTAEKDYVHDDFCMNGHDYWIAAQDIDDPRLREYIDGSIFTRKELKEKLK